MKMLNYEFSDWLTDSKLAWNTREFEGHDTYGWLTMHPRLASAIMSVLALAIARQDGLRIVTPSQRTHEMLLANTEQQVIARLLDMPEFLEEDGGDGVSVQEPGGDSAWKAITGGRHRFTEGRGITLAV
jgi:hypothetical protein